MHKFTAEFRSEFVNLLKWRRDVRHFKTTPVPEDSLAECLDAFRLSPSVGLSEPWRIVSLDSEAARAKAYANFQIQNDAALAGYSGDKAKTYASLKLAGMKEAPVQFAIFCDEETEKGSGLGAATMAETRRYSVVSAIMSFWLVARAYGLGVGWVSILDADQLRGDLGVPDSWSLVAYLCVGYPTEESLQPELEAKGWEERAETVDVISR
ncbi:5,6-dimethylbenzimidazole synthase [Neptunicoccus sediminis]|uniref:5,6-dimethylbenzimidazole synthase n=1 Tax=Neptunicoccus sediminis TaxID=1892596 RepID=UPI000845E1D7|nr:5,6-dimethylbenzimidazole synthase [Neptunicoccus sediminis]